MNSEGQLCVKLIHCGNKNIANRKDVSEKNVFYMPMGLFPLASVLKQNGIDAEIIHLDLVTGDQIEDILDFRTLDAVGLDCHWANQSLGVLDTARLIKKLNPDVFVFLGGYTASFFAGEIMSEYLAVDAIIRGDGEVPIVALCRRLFGSLDNRSNIALDDVPNLVWRRNENELVVNEISYVAAAHDMERLEFAEVDLLRDWKWYRDLCTFPTRFTPLNSMPQFLLEVGRGCPYACSFCGGNVEAQRRISNRNKPVVRSVDSVIHTIRKAASFGFSFFYTSFEFEGSDEWYIELFRRIEKEKLDIAFGYGCWRIPSRPLMDAISKSCRWALIEISPETGVAELRRRNKDNRLFYTNTELEQCLDYMGAKENVKAQLFFGHYLPFDTVETVFATLSYITQLFSEYSRFVEFEYDNLSTDPCSLLYLYPEKYQVDIQVRCFTDYMAKLEEYYLMGKDPLPDMTMFRPRGISEAESGVVSTKLRLFKHLLSDFPNSVLMVMAKSKTANVISDYLCKVDLSSLWSVDAKDVLLNICEEHSLLSAELIELVTREHDKRRQRRQWSLYKMAF